MPALFVEPEVDEVAVLVGERIIDRIVRRIADGEQDHVIGRVTLADELFQGISGLLGICLPTLDITDEMRTRGSPHVLDLLVAFISGIAAAYAIGRPNLSPALPGVAIAAALVPPVATAGLAAAGWEWRLAGGSLLLFLTNIVAIILGTACSLWLVGIRDSHRHGTVQRWSRPLSWSLCLLAVFLAIYESLPSAPVPNRLRQQIQTTVEKVVPEGQVVHIRRQARRNPVEMTVEVATPRTDVEDLHPQLIQVISQYYDRPVVLRLEFHWVRIGRSNSSVLP